MLNATAPPALPDTGMGPAFKIVGALFLVLALVMLIHYLLRRFKLFGGSVQGRNGLTLLGRLALGPRQGLHLVRFRGKTLLLGVTDHQITLLTEADDIHEGAAPDFAQKLADQTDPSDPL